MEGGPIISMQEVFKYQRVVTPDSKSSAALRTASHFSERFKLWGYDLPAAIFEEDPSRCAMSLWQWVKKPRRFQRNPSSTPSFCGLYRGERHLPRCLRHQFNNKGEPSP
jgi:hypothetical protein